MTPTLEDILEIKEMIRKLGDTVNEQQDQINKITNIITQQETKGDTTLVVIKKHQEAISRHTDFLERIQEALGIQGDQIEDLTDTVEKIDAYTDNETMTELDVNSIVDSKIHEVDTNLNNQPAASKQHCWCCRLLDPASYILKQLVGFRLTHLYYVGLLKRKTMVIPGMHHTEKINQLAIHNLHAIKLEVDKVKQAIHEGRLWEYVIKKARAHPKLFEMVEVMTQNNEFLNIGTPKFKERAIFLFDKEDQFRPEVQSFHEIVRKFKSKKKKLLITSESSTKPGYLSHQFVNISKKLKDFDEVLRIFSQRVVSVGEE